MPEKTPAARGERLVDALLAWITAGRGEGIHHHCSRSIHVSPASETRISKRLMPPRRLARRPAAR